MCEHREDFSMENMEQESQAQALLDQSINLLRSIAQQNANVVYRMKLMQISRNMVGEFFTHYHQTELKARLVCTAFNSWLLRNLL